MLFRFKNTSRTAVFVRRTAFLLIPIPITVGVVRNTSQSGFGHLLSIPLSSDIYGIRGFAPVSMLNYIFNNRNSDIHGLRNYGNTWLYYPSNYYYDNEFGDEDPAKAFTIENLQPLNLGQFGDDFSFAPISVKQQSTTAKLMSSQQNQPLSPKLDITRKTKDPSSSSDVLEEYYLDQENFTQSIFSEKGDLQLIVDLNINFDDGESTASPTVIDLSQFIVENSVEIPLISVTTPDNSSSKTTFTLKVDKSQSGGNTLNLTLKKIAPSNPSPPNNNQGSVDISIRSFYLMFSESPALSFEDIFTQTENQFSSTNTFSSEHKIKRIYLDSWTNKTKNTWGKSTPQASSSSPSQTDQSQFDFKNTNGFWKSFCTDVYKIGGFIDPQQNASSSDTTTTSTLDDNQAYVKQQKSLHEDFDPREDRMAKPESTTLKTANQNTTPTPCSGLESETKTLLKEFAKPQNGQPQTSTTLTNEPHHKIDWHLTPKPIKDLLEDNTSNTSNTSKVIQGSFRAWGSGYSTDQNKDAKNSYDILKEESIKTEHHFDVTIDKETLKSKLINHTKLSNSDANSSNKKLNELKEISSSVQVSIPYSFSLYDPVANFLSRQRINLSLSLDLRSIYNQSKSFKEFYTYDIGTNHPDIGIDYQGKSPTTSPSSGVKYGLSGTISFGATLYLDLDANLKIQLVTKTKGFVSTKKSVCDWRNRIYKQNNGQQNNGQQNTCNGANSSEGWQYRKHNHIPPFIVLEIHEDPKISSFYFDRRINLADGTTTSSTVGDISQSSTNKVETLKALSDQLDKSDRTVEIIRQMDQTNNAEVYFAKLDVTDKTSREQQKAISQQIGSNGQVIATQESGWLSSNYSWFNYYIPRRHYGEIFIDDENLDEIVIHLKGSSALGSSFFQSMHFGTKMTYCRSSTSSSTSTNECGDGQKYDTIEKDKGSKELDTKNTTSVKVNFSDIKTSTSSSPKTFNFQTVIHRAAPLGDGKDTNTFDTNKSKFEVLFKDDSSDALKKSNITTITTKIPNFSLVGVWYSLEVWYDSSGKKICYYTKLRAISSIAATSDRDGTQEVSNTETHKVPGASAKAGFELSKIEFKYKKSSSTQKK